MTAWLICYVCSRKLRRIDYKADTHGLCPDCLKQQLADTRRAVEEHKKRKGKG